MSNQFKPGDLALTKVFDVDIPAGSLVELAERIEKGTLIRGKGYAFKAPTPGWYVIHNGSGARTAYGENELIPLRGDFAPEQQKAKEAQPA
ncbi:hypothetical protein [Pseudomonas viridiflava]|uniref:hypothetical protein n=1 Tax=Pseudomonas viridiflava TaxID=33069 RepID=UPI000F063646|nr:hypothetical protein [Pseudomonas viridiflava]